jgi:aminopeptidase N
VTNGNNGAAGGGRKFKYVREDFGPLPVKLNHLTISINFTDSGVEGLNTLDMTAIEELDSIVLDASDLEVRSVKLCSSQADAEGTELRFDYKKEDDKLRVYLPDRVAPGERFFVRTETLCTPTDNILEGLYTDATPPGAPQQYMSQCQQWGFQRIMPIFDDCTAKCTMSTTIEADAGYTHLISNGNIDRTSNPDGRPVPKPGDPSRQVITFDNPIPMSPYLFLVCVGTWEVLEDSVTYPSGRTVALEYLVPAGSIDDARIPMDILKESVLWIEKTQGYEYTFDTYRTICMTKSNFGGMENLGNTTIVTDAAMITAHTLDAMVLYAHAVIVHEFEHNQCGSETTMADHFDPSFARLREIDSVRAPLAGPLAIEDAGHYGRIVREGFNEPDELIDGVTYVKAAEVIRMLRLIIGADKFKAAKSLYFKRYHLGNANNDQFFACFEEVSGMKFDRFKSEWLYRVGYPKVTATTHYDASAKTFKITFKQAGVEGAEPFVLPILLALVNSDGQDIEGTERIFVLDSAKAELTLEGITEAPAVASINRDSSFYGTFTLEGSSPEALVAQVRLDPNTYNRVDAMRKLTDRVRVALLETPDIEAANVEEIGAEWLALYAELLADRTLPPALKAYFLRIDESPIDRRYTTWYQELVTVREAMARAVNRRFRSELLKEFEASKSATVVGTGPSAGIEERLYRNVLLELISVDDMPESHALLIDTFSAATNTTERVAALVALNRSSSEKRREILAGVYADWHTHLSGYANYLRVVSSGTCDDVFDMIEEEKARETFDINQPTWNRALFMAMAMNNKMVWTERGIAWVADTVIMLAPINSSTAGRLLSTFQHAKNLKPALGKSVAVALERVVSEVSVEVSASINGQAKVYLG